MFFSDYASLLLLTSLNQPIVQSVKRCNITRLIRVDCSSEAKEIRPLRIRSFLGTRPGQVWYTDIVNYSFTNH